MHGAQTTTIWPSFLVHVMLGQHRCPFVASNAVSWLYISCSILKIFATRPKSRNRRRKKLTEIAGLDIDGLDIAGLDIDGRLWTIDYNILTE